ncbi:MAG: HDIG domain-containing protein [Thermodesulfobacteriota bacterium]|nr:HDIG domain-containing protein [Thermodesulfobacteriota bacterium]
MTSKINKNSVSKFFDDSYRFRWAVMIGVTIIFTFILYPNLILIKHSYKLGDVAERDIKAPKGFLIEDIQATETNRKQAAEKVLTVYDHDTALSFALTQRVNQAFADLQAVFNTESANKDSAKKPKTDSSIATDKKTSIHEQVWEMKKEFERKIGFNVSDGAYKILEKEKFSDGSVKLIIKILSKILQNGVVSNKAILLKEADKGIILRSIETTNETVVKNLKLFYGMDQANAMVKIIGQPLLKNRRYTTKNMIVDFVQHLIVPNITLNRSETEERRKKAASAIKPILHQIKNGEMLLREGELVTKVQLLKLKTLQAQTRKEHIVSKSIGAAMIILCLLVTTYILHIPQQKRMANKHNKNLLFISIVIITFCFLADISASLSESLIANVSYSIPASSVAYGFPLAAGAMIICLFLGLEIAIPFAMVIAICIAAIFQNSFESFLFFLINGTMAAYWIRDCRERKVFIKAGAKLGLLNVVLVVATDFYIADFSMSKLLWHSGFAFMGGIGAGIITAGIAPLIEIAFDYTTDIKLLELANLDQPILRRLMMEAPGTYHHSVIVGSMVEAAATEIGANPLLAKVCGYYHDIGKIGKPLYFIENQTTGKNRHDKLAPSMSSLILIAHIKNGVEIAKKNKLGQVIVDAIQQHHGTSLIRYFYDKAVQQRREDAVNIDNFRYPGPLPQTKEIGLVMLADVVEAASRTLANPTTSRLQGLVQNLINNIFSDGQLDNCELTLKDLHSIAKSFNKILHGIHHHRIEYPDKRVSNNGKRKNGNSYKRQANKTQNIENKNTKESAGHLKRLGQS